MRTIVWFRGKDLRIHDHAPLRDAARDGDVIPVFVMEPFFFSATGAREAPHRMQFLLDSLGDLDARLRARGSRLVLWEGRGVDVIPDLARRFRADRVWAHRRSEPWGRSCDERIAQSLGEEFRLYEGETLAHPSSVLTGTGRPYAVFTPFMRAFLSQVQVGAPLPAPRRLPPIPPDIEVAWRPLPGEARLGITRNPGVIKGGETSARLRLERFLSRDRYDTERDRMDLDSTSRLSADLKFGTVSVREAWSQSLEKTGEAPGGLLFRNQLLWREFGYSMLWNYPHVLERPFNARFERFPWQFNKTGWRAWTEGRTGFPIVDAAARQLLSEGFVHNRARMIAASFLIKQLLIDYGLGEMHYMKYLADGDRAQNNMGWQWSAGCGSSAQPYFRVFNPVRQAQRFDPGGGYVRRWVPELGKLSVRHIHSPWTASREALAQAGIRLGKDYPRPIVDPDESRKRFLVLARNHLRPDGPGGSEQNRNGTVRTSNSVEL